MVESTTSSPPGAREIATRIASGDLSARGVVEEHIRRIEEVNPRLNAVVVPLFDRALSEAAIADEARSRGEPLGPLHGVPVAAASLRARGAQVEEWTPPDVAEAMRIYLGVASADRGAGYRHTLGKNERDRRITGLLRAAGLPNMVRPVIGGLLERAGQRHLAGTLRSMGWRSAAGYWKLVERRNSYRARFLAELDAGGFDAIVCPPHALPALPHGASEYLLAASSYSLLYNTLGMPAGVVAATRVGADEESDRPDSRDLAYRTARKTEENSAGLPVGVQVVARHWRDDIVLTLMAELERHFRAQPGYSARPRI